MNSHIDMYLYYFFPNEKKKYLSIEMKTVKFMRNEHYCNSNSISMSSV